MKMKKYMAGYITGGIGLIFVTGLFGFIIGTADLQKEETSQYIVEIFSSFMGSMYLAFLLGRIRQKEWDHKRTPKEKLFYCAAGFLLFGARVVSRLVWIGLDRLQKTNMGYPLCILTDVCTLAGIWFLIPHVKKEVCENE
ncbi:MAG: hypothetical protein J6K58_14055 [Lachnospiraceae bacterium]|nr:hypothetical protein [Lachnospiraceae bacterium]